MRTEQLTEVFGVKITGIDVMSMSGEERQAILVLANSAGVVLLPGQDLTQQDQLRFTQTFGPVRILEANPGKKVTTLPGIVGISNLDANGNPVAPDAKAMRFSKANMLWHSDYSYTQDWSAQSMLYAEQAVSSGGETEFASSEAAYLALPEEDKARFQGMTAVHDLLLARRREGFGDFNDEDRARLPPARHPLVPRHPVTGKKSLLLGSHLCGVDGMTQEESDQLITELTAFATQPKFVYSHRWTPGDLLIWDNRSTLHRGRPADPGEPRVMRRTAVHNSATGGDFPALN